MEPYKDSDLMEFGAHKGKKLIDIPAGYLLWLDEQDWLKQSNSRRDVRMKEYINENREVLLKELKTA